jgi:molecular chaperone IbpA
MRTFDFSPFSRSTVGFENIFDRLNNMQPPEKTEGFPAYDIARTGDDAFRITLAVAGFAPGDLSITAQQNLLLVTGRKSPEGQREYLHRGISDRAFERRFDLADYIEVHKASYDNGLLTIDLIRRIPEAMKPRRVEIGSSSKQAAKAA